MESFQEFRMRGRQILMMKGRMNTQEGRKQRLREERIRARQNNDFTAGVGSQTFPLLDSFKTDRPEL
jgi:hypothetical protein